MVFNEREAIRFRMEKIAEEKEKLHQRDKALDKEYTFYIERLRYLDQHGPEDSAVESHHSQQKQKTYNGDLKQYDFDALKKGLSHVKTKLPEEIDEIGVIGNLPDKQADRRRRGKQYNLKEVATIVEGILLDNEAPMEIRKLRLLLNDKGFTWKHFWPTLSNIMKHSGHIKKPSRGMIAYVPGESKSGGSEPAENVTDLADYTSGPSEAASAEDVSENKAESDDVKAAADEVPDSVFSEQGEK